MHVLGNQLERVPGALRGGFVMTSVPAHKVLVDCPRNCGYKVQAGKAGDPHRIVDPLDSSKMITCGG